MFVEKSCVWISILFERVDNTKSQAPPKKKTVRMERMVTVYGKISNHNRKVSMNGAIQPQVSMKSTF